MEVTETALQLRSLGETATYSVEMGVASDCGKSRTGGTSAATGGDSTEMEVAETAKAGHSDITGRS